MANLPMILAEPSDFPTSSRTPRGDQRVRPIPYGGMDPGAASVFGRAVSDLGKSLGQFDLDNFTGLEDKKRKARDTLGAMQLTNEFIQKYDTYEADSRRQADYEQHPQRMDTYAKQLKEEYALRVKNLLPEAQQRFDISTGDHVNVVNRNALKYRDERFFRQRDSVLEETDTKFQQEMLETPDPIQQQLVVDRYQQQYADLEAVGLIYPAERQTRIRQSLRDVKGKQVDLAIEAQPDVAFDDLERLQNNEAPQNPLFADIERGELPKLIEKARVRTAQQLDFHEKQERHKEAERLREVDAELRQYQARLTAPNATIGQLQALHKELSQFAEVKGLRAGAVENELRYINSRINQEEAEARAAASAARVEASQRRMEERQMQQLRSNQILMQNMGNIYGDVPRLSPNDILAIPGIGGADPNLVRTLMQDSRERLNAAHVSNQLEYKQVLQFGESQILGPQSDIVLLESSGVTELQDLAKRRKENYGQFQAELFRTATEMSGPQGVDTKAFRENWERIARDLSGRYTSMGEPPRPPVGLETPEAIVNAWQQKRISEKAMEGHLLLLREYTKYKTRTTPAAPAAPAKPPEKTLWQRFRGQ